MAAHFSRRTTKVYFEASGAGGVLLIDHGPGDVKYSGDEQGNVAVDAIMDSGRFDGLSETDDKQISWSISLTDVASPATSAVLQLVEDFVNHSGAFAPLQSVESGAWAWNVRIVAEMNGVRAERLLTSCRATIDYAAGSPSNTRTISGTCYGGVTRS